MKLILAAEENCNDGIAAELTRLLNDALLGKKVALIPNAGIGIDRSAMVNKLIDDFVTHRGMNMTVVDVEEMLRDDILKILNEADVVCFSGGLVSRLIKAIDNKGLRTRILYLLKTKVFVTFSAGTMSMSKSQTLAHNFIGDPDPDVKGLSGFGVIDFEIYPHYKEQQHDAILEIITEGLEVWAIRDEEAIVIDGDDIRFVGNPIQLRVKS